MGCSALNNFEVNIGTFTQDGTTTSAHTSTVGFLSGSQSLRVSGDGGTVSLNGVVASIAANATSVNSWYYEQAVGTLDSAVIAGFTSGTGLTANTYQTAPQGAFACLALREPPHAGVPR